MKSLRTRHRLPGLAALPLLLAASLAAPRVQAAADGAAIATKGTPNGVAACASCHGAKGEGNAAANFPRLAGLPAAYLSAQLKNFAEGARQSPVMGPQAKAMKAEEREAVSAYFAALPAAAGIAPRHADDLTTRDTGEWLALRGRWDQELPACVQCHGPGGIGVGSAFPPIAGQPPGYIAAQLHAFKDGSRPEGPLNLMSVVARRMADADMTAVADYFGGASPAPVSGAAANGKGERK
jgi:cytochrome c553